MTLHQLLSSGILHGKIYLKQVRHDGEFLIDDDRYASSSHRDFEWIIYLLQRHKDLLSHPVEIEIRHKHFMVLIKGMTIYTANFI